MNWISSRITLPVENQEVLTFIEGEFDIAVFNKTNGGFKLSDGAFLWIEDKEIFWVNLTPPPKQ